MSGILLFISNMSNMKICDVWAKECKKYHDRQYCLTAYDVDMLVNVIKWVVKYHHNASFSLMNITLQVIESSKSKIMSLLR
jgi:hypothetical protein